jgi:hypothetical protein
MKHLGKCSLIWLLADGSNTNDASEVSVKSFYKLGLQLAQSGIVDKKEHVLTCSTRLAIENFSVSLTNGCTFPFRICSSYATTLGRSSKTCTCTGAGAAGAGAAVGVDVFEGCGTLLSECS